MLTIITVIMSLEITVQSMASQIKPMINIRLRLKITYKVYVQKKDDVFPLLKDYEQACCAGCRRTPFPIKRHNKKNPSIQQNSGNC